MTLERTLQQKFPQLEDKSKTLKHLIKIYSFKTKSINNKRIQYKKQRNSWKQKQIKCSFLTISERIPLKN